MIYLLISFRAFHSMHVLDCNEVIVFLVQKKQFELVGSDEKGSVATILSEGKSES